MEGNSGSQTLDLVQVVVRLLLKDEHGFAPVGPRLTGGTRVDQLVKMRAFKTNAWHFVPPKVLDLHIKKPPTHGCCRDDINLCLLAWLKGLKLVLFINKDNNCLSNILLEWGHNLLQPWSQCWNGSMTPPTDAIVNLITSFKWLDKSRRPLPPDVFLQTSIFFSVHMNMKMSYPCSSEESLIWARVHVSKHPPVSSFIAVWAVGPEKTSLFAVVRCCGETMSPWIFCG